MNITQKITIEERDIPLLLNLSALAEILDQIGEVTDFRELFSGKKRLKHTITLITILGNTGLAEIGKPADLTEEYIGKHLHPLYVGEAQAACMAAITDGMRVETKPADDGPRDMTLEEIEKKSTR